MKEFEFRNIVREIIKENLSKEERYVATIDFYVHAENEKEAIEISKEIASKIDLKLDNNASLVKLTKQSFGTIGGSSVDF